MAKSIYGSDMAQVTEGEAPRYPTTEELWNLTFARANAWRDRFAAVPFEDKGGFFLPRYYQDPAIGRALEAVAGSENRILLTLATGKTFIAFRSPGSSSTAGGTSPASRLAALASCS